MENLYHTVVESPIGPLTAIASENGLCALEFDKPDRQPLPESRLSRWFPNQQVVLGSHRFLDDVGTWLMQYFAGRFESLGTVALDLRGTQFERKVWERLLKIALRSTSTYGALAAELELAHGARAVGLAVGRNPVSILVPCHRVVRHNGSLTGYGGGLERKRFLLALEKCSAVNESPAIAACA